MEKTRCCVCHDFFAPADVKWIGGRSFCERHHALALEATETHWSRAGLIETALVVGFIGVVSLVFGSDALPTGEATGLALALVPAGLFLLFVYRQDRIEPEPVHMVLGIFALGILLGHGLIDPIGEALMDDGWRHRSSIGSWVASIGIGGTLSIFAAYLAVRYTVYLTDEFDEPVDGIVYATAASLGLATAANMDFVAHHEGVLPVAGATLMASTTLIHVAAGVVLGYGMSRARFDPEEGQRVLTAAFIASVFLHGVLHELVVLTGTMRGDFEPMLAFALVAVLAALVLAGAHRITVLFARQALEEGNVV